MSLPRDPYRQAQPDVYVGMLLTAVAGILGTVAVACGSPFWPTVAAAATSVPVLTAAILTTGRLLESRVRIRVAHQPRLALVLTDTPRPDCPHCHGTGGWAKYAQDGPNPEDGERLHVPCDCWSTWHRRLVPIPTSLARRLGWWLPDDGYSDEPPF